MAFDGIKSKSIDPLVDQWPKIRAAIFLDPTLYVAAVEYLSTLYQGIDRTVQGSSCERIEVASAVAIMLQSGRQPQRRAQSDVSRFQSTRSRPRQSLGNK